MSTKTITIDNYQDFKPSEFVRSFASDVDVAIRRGKPMFMASFYDQQTVDGVECLPCLGGMACMNMGIPLQYGLPQNSLQTIVSNLGDSIRTGDKRSIVNWLERLYPDRNIQFTPGSLQGFFGVTKRRSLLLLQKQIHQIADALEESGC